MPSVLNPRGLEAALAALGSAGNIKPGQIYLLTDQNRIAIGLTPNTYEVFAKLSEIQLPVVKTLSANFASTSTTLADVTDLTIPVVAGKKYCIEILGTYQTGVTTTGGKLGLGFSGGGAGSFFGKFEGGVSASSVATELVIPVSSVSSVLTTTGVSVINTPHYIGGKFIFTCTQTGNLILKWASEVNATSAQLNAGTTVLINALN